MVVRNGYRRPELMKKGIFYLPDKSVVVRTFAPKSKRPNETEEQWMERLMKRNPPSSSSEIIDSSKLPQSRENRNAWEGKKGKKITINPTKVEAINRKKQVVEKEKEIIRRMAEKEIDSG